LDQFQVGPEKTSGEFFFNPAHLTDKFFFNVGLGRAKIFGLGHNQIKLEVRSSWWGGAWST
jgi:hypothetical protein